MRLLALAAVVVAGTLAIGGKPAKRDVGVLMIDAGSGARTRVTSIAGHVAWSGDGSRLYVTSGGEFADHPTQTFDVFDARGRRVSRRVLRTADVAAGEVAVSPDGRRIAYLGPSRDREEVNTGELIVAGRRLLSRARGTPAWSPDGKRIAVERWSLPDAHGDEGGSPPRVVILDPASGQIRRTLRGSAPSWLPDGRLVVFRGGSLIVDGRTILRGDQTEWDAYAGRIAAGGGPVRIVNLADGMVTQLTDQPVGDVSWSPDGTKLAALAHDRILLVDSSGAHELTRIAGRLLFDLEWSPDGSHLAVAATVPSHGD